MTSLRYLSSVCIFFLIFLAIEVHRTSNSDPYPIEHHVSSDAQTSSTANPSSVVPKYSTTGSPNSSTTRIYNEFIAEKDTNKLLRRTLDVVKTSYAFLEKIEGPKMRFPTQEEYTNLKKLLYSDKAYKKYYCMENPANMREDIDIKQIRDSSCNSPLISINFYGRTGNQISQYLSLLLLHLKYNANIVINSEMEAYLRLLFLHRSIPVIPIYCEEHYNNTYLLYNNVFTALNYHRKQAVQADFPYVYENTLEFPRIFIKSYPCPVYLLMDQRELMTKEMRILPYIQNQAKKTLKEIIPNEFKKSPLISVHVRRTDYVEHVERHHHKPLTMNYYNRAMNFFRNATRFGRPLFLIFSDDPEWCKMHFLDRDVLIAGDGDQENFLLDFAMITRCDHHIAGYGTFSFTSAFLSTGIIVYPLPVVPPERVFGVQQDYLCSDSEELVPIPDLFQINRFDMLTPV